MRVSRFKAIGYLADSQLRPIGWTVDERIAGAQSSEGAMKDGLLFVRSHRARVSSPMLGVMLGSTKDIWLAEVMIETGRSLVGCVGRLSLRIVFGSRNILSQ